jgi:hypothetical protein
MIQDTGLGQEMLVSAYETINEDGTTKLCCYRYTDDPIEVYIYIKNKLDDLLLFGIVT